jgi:hypothetical protein
MTIAEMIRTHPGPTRVDLTQALEVLAECAQTCTSCADACLGEEHHLSELVTCVRLNLDCADICEATARVLTRQTAFQPATARAMLEACIAACAACAEECERHAEMGMEHCRICAEACRRCEGACREALGRLAA